MNKLAIVILMFSVAGCATSSKMKNARVFEVPKGSRIGVINFVGQKMKQYHIGTTAFNNFNKEHDGDWNIPGFINEEIKRQASEIGYEVKIIEADDNLKASLSDRTIAEGDEIVLKHDVVPILKQMSKEHDLSMLFIFEEAKGQISIPNTFVNAEGYGAGTRNFLALGGVMAFAIIDASAIWLKPVSLMNGAKCHRQKDVSGSDMIGNFRKLSDKELTKISDIIKTFIKGFVSALMVKSNLKKL